MTNVSVKMKRRKSVVVGKAASLFIQVIVGRRVRRVPLDWRLRENEWDTGLEAVHIPPGTSRERGEYLLRVTDGLEKARSVVRGVIGGLEKRVCFTVEDVVTGYLAQSGLTRWADYLDRQTKVVLQEGREATARHYRSLKQSLNGFLQGRDIAMGSIDEGLVCDYEAYLTTRGLAPNTISFYLRVMRTVWNKALHDGLVEWRPSPFRCVNTRVEKTGKRAVDTAVIDELERLGQSLEPGQAQALDLFLFCYYTRGMAFVDLARLTRDNIQGNTLVYKRKKTGQELRVRLLPVMSRLIDRYRCPDSPYLFPILKARNAGYREYESALRLQNMRLRRIGRRLGVKLSTYVARHSWASAAKKRGVSDELISEGMGHTSVKTTRIYIKLFDNSRLDRMNEYVITGRKQPMGSLGARFP